MNKRLMGIMLGSIMILILVGCGKKIDYSLPDDPIAFETGPLPE